MTNPLLADWVKNGLAWKTRLEPSAISPIALAVGAKVQIPVEEDFKGQEGVLLNLWATFDSPWGGISFQASPETDWEDRYTVNRMTAIGQSRVGNIMYSAIPPTTAAGIFSIFFEGDYPWTEWARLFVFNGGPAAINCLDYGYTLAYLAEPRPRPCCDRIIEELRRLQQILLPPGTPPPAIIPPVEEPPAEEEPGDPIEVSGLRYSGEEVRW